MKQERKSFSYEGRQIYEWDQSLDTIFCFIALPPLPTNIKVSSVLDVKITSSSLSVGLKKNDPYLNHQFSGVADSEESLWYLQDVKNSNQKNETKELVVELQKAQKGVRWGSVFKGHENVNPVQEEQTKKKLMLERFQEEHPGFDFSGAQFNGQVHKPEISWEE